MVRISGFAYRFNKKWTMASCVVPKETAKIICDLYSGKGYKVGIEKVEAENV